MDDATVEYIWENYSYYIDLESDYLKILRAKLTPLNENDPFKEKVVEYKEKSPEELQEKIIELSVTKRNELANTVLNKYHDKIHLNHCSKCNILTKTEKSEHCLHCGHTWYGENPIRKANEENS